MTKFQEECQHNKTKDRVIVDEDGRRYQQVICTRCKLVLNEYEYYLDADDMPGHRG